MSRVSALGEYLRYRSALPPRLSEFAILITAAHWRQQFEWEIHAPIALLTGLPQSALDALWSGTRPIDLERDQQVLYELCIEVHRDRKVSTPVRERAHQLLGEQGTIDAISICGYYALLAMVLNARAAK